MHVEEEWLDPWRGGEEACLSCHGVGAAAVEWEERGRGHNGGEEEVCGGGARSSDAE
jgi:hypothetical protein